MNRHNNVAWIGSCMAAFAFKSTNQTGFLIISFLYLTRLMLDTIRKHVRHFSYVYCAVKVKFL